MAPVYSLVDLALLQVPDAGVPDHLLARLDFVRTRRRVQTLLRFPTQQHSVFETRPCDPDIFLLDLPNGVSLLWYVTLDPSAAFNWVIFECYHEGPALQKLAEYVHRVKWNKRFEGQNTYTVSLRP